MDKSLKDEVLETLKNIKVKLGIIKDEPQENKVATKEGKEITYLGELKEGVEVKCGDETLNGTIELADDRKMVVSEGKFVKFEAVSGDEPNKEIVELKEVVDTLKSENVQLKADLKVAIEASNATLAAVEKIALAFESEEKPAGGGGEGEGLTKSEWIHKRVTEGK